MSRRNRTELSPFQARVYPLLLTNLSNREIGIKLSVGLNTIQNATVEIYTKLGTQDRVDLMAREIERLSGNL